MNNNMGLGPVSLVKKEKEKEKRKNYNKLTKRVNVQYIC